jgi:hypothetical protein
VWYGADVADDEQAGWASHALGFDLDAFIPCGVVGALHRQPAKVHVNIAVRDVYKSVLLDVSNFGAHYFSHDSD